MSFQARVTFILWKHQDHTWSLSAFVCGGTQYVIWLHSSISIINHWNLSKLSFPIMLIRQVNYEIMFRNLSLNHFKTYHQFLANEVLLNWLQWQKINQVKQIQIQRKQQGFSGGLVLGFKLHLQNSVSFVTKKTITNYIWYKLKHSFF